MEVGKRNTLTVIKSVPHGLYLDDGDGDGILLPRRYVPKGLELGDSLEVFVYRDSEDRLIATTETPKIMVGQCAYLRVVAVNNVGAFLDWGLPKDLLVPYGQQAERMEAGRSYVVTAYIDSNTNRVVASSRLGRWLKEEGTRFRVGQEVDLLISNRTDLGWKAVINHTHVGLVFHSDADDSMWPGRRMRGYIKRVRTEDERIDLALAPDRARTRRNLEEEIIAHLEVNEGHADLGDHTSPAQVMALFGVSKGNFKKALGALYRARRIVIADDGISLEAGGGVENAKAARGKVAKPGGKRHVGAKKEGANKAGKKAGKKATTRGRGESKPSGPGARQDKPFRKDRPRTGSDRDAPDRVEEKPRGAIKTGKEKLKDDRPGKASPRKQGRDGEEFARSGKSKTTASKSAKTDRSSPKAARQRTGPTKDAPEKSAASKSRPARPATRKSGAGRSAGDNAPGKAKPRSRS